MASGSIIQGVGTKYSDLDSIVVFSTIEAAYRESFLLDDMPVDAFVHDYETLQSLLQSLGGYLFDGNKIFAPITKRKKAEWMD